MNGDHYASLIYLGLILAALAGWAFMQMRSNISRSLQHIAVWGLLFVGLMAGYGLWHDIRGDVLNTQSQLPNGQIELPRDASGHYHAVLQVNDVPVEFIVDTGATGIVLNRQDAARVGIDTEALAYIGEASTANGTVAIAPVRLAQMALGPVVAQDVRAMVTGGEMDMSLLGMSYLDRFSKIEIVGGKLLLTP